MLGFRTAPVGGEGLRTRDARRVCAQRATGLPAPFPSEAWRRGLPSLVCRLVWGPGGGRGDDRGTPWLERLGTCSCGPEGLVSWTGGRNVRRGLFCKTCSPRIAALPGYYVHFGERTFQTERNKSSPVKWTVDFSFVEMNAHGKVGWGTLPPLAWQLPGPVNGLEKLL